MPPDQFEFGIYRLDSKSAMLFREGEHVALPPKVTELLVALVQAEGKVLSREELQQRLWPTTIVEEGSLTSHISLLRKALGENPKTQDFIETIPKRGYRFAALVKRPVSGTCERGGNTTLLLVLPFENFTAGNKYDYFSDGLTEEMITELARLSPDRLGVIARTSAMQFKSTTKSIAQIGAELSVSHVLEGSVRRQGGRVRITAQLIRVSDESHLWAENYERGLHDVLEVQSEVARAVAREIQIKLTPREQRRLDNDKTRSINPQAHELYLRGRHFWYRRTEEGLRKSIECFEQSLQYDPSFAAAYDGISDSHTMLACRGMTPAHESFSTKPRLRPDKRFDYSPSWAKPMHRWLMYVCMTGIGWAWRVSSSKRWISTLGMPSHTTGTRNISWRWAGLARRSLVWNAARSWIH